MVDYYGVNATIRSIEPNPLNHKFSAIVEAENGKYYQVKFCQAGGHKNNINEFIGHYISKLIDAPVLDGAFLKLTDSELQKLVDKISLYPAFKPIDISISKENFFFGVEWIKDINEIKSPKELVKKLKTTSNSKSFYSLYPIDQITKNYDRHLGNHLISRKGKKVFYNMIDFDRIFNGTTWVNTTFLDNDFNCLISPTSPNQFNELEFLYSLVNNTNFDLVADFSAKLSNITEEDIDDMCSQIEHIYTVSKPEVATIREWFLKRKERIHNECLNNIDCFANVTYQRLKDVHRHYIQTK